MNAKRFLQTAMLEDGVRKLQSSDTELYHSLVELFRLCLQLRNECIFLSKVVLEFIHAFR